MIELTDEQRANLLKWVKALESGKYTQTTGVLRDKYGYCCLGVACEVLGLEGRYDNKVMCYTYGTDNSFSQLPIEVRGLLGINKFGEFDKPIKMPNGRLYNSLSSLNDDSRYGFKTIAKVIRKVWLGKK